jgi:hypothetical protein
MEAICGLNKINRETGAEDTPASSAQISEPISFYQRQLKGNLNKLHATERVSALNFIQRQLFILDSGG